MSVYYEQARALLAQALKLEPDAIGADAAIGTLDAWDSLAHMRLILALEEYLGRPLAAETIVGIASLPDVVTVLEGRPLTTPPTTLP